MTATHVVGIRLNLVFECDDHEVARWAAYQFGRLLSEGHDPLTATICLVDDGKPPVKRVVFVGHETGYQLIPNEPSAPASRPTP